MKENEGWMKRNEGKYEEMKDDVRGKENKNKQA